MDFSEIYQMSAPGLCSWSPSGKFLANTLNARLVIRDADSLQIVQLYTLVLFVVISTNFVQLP